MIYVALGRFVNSNGFVGKFVEKQKSSRVWSGIVDFFNEIYICLCFSVGINTSLAGIDSASTAVNNIYAGLFGITVILGPILFVKAVSKAFKQ